MASSVGVNLLTGGNHSNWARGFKAEKEIRQKQLFRLLPSWSRPKLFHSV
jgi:hypothetical protein